MKNEFLRHTLATISYRFQKAIETIGDNFADFSLGKGSRTPIEIIHHIFQVIAFSRRIIEDQKLGKGIVEKGTLKNEIEQFIAEIKQLDKILSEKEITIKLCKRLIQGPFSDILTHIGQISMMNGLNGNPTKGEDFSSALIETGKI